MPTTQALPSPDVRNAIRLDCERALRRLDVLIAERDDVLLHHVRQYVRHAAALASAP